MTQKKYETPFKKACGLGSAKEGVGHWWSQRVSAVALVFLGLWIAYVVSVTMSFNAVGAKQLLAQTHYMVPLLFFIMFSFYHAWLGLKVIIEDYVHHKFLKYTLLILTQLACLFAGGLGIFFLLSIWIKG